MLLNVVKKVSRVATVVMAMGLFILAYDRDTVWAVAGNETAGYAMGVFSEAEKAELTASAELTADGTVRNPIDTAMLLKGREEQGQGMSAQEEAVPAPVSEDPEDPRNYKDTEAGSGGLKSYIIPDDTYEGSDAVFPERMVSIYTCGMKFVTEIPDDSDSGKVRFYTSDRDVAEVTKLGRVLAMAPGECVMTAICDNGSVHTMKVIVRDKPETNRMVALTFDDGPCWLGDQLMDFLDEVNIKVTFFYEGVNIRDNVDRAVRAYNSGHEIGNHSWDHLELTRLSAEDIQKDVSRCQEAIYNAIGAYPTIMRPPYGSYNTKVKENVTLPMITWNVDPEDWKYLDAEKVAKDLLEGSSDGNIILIHEIHISTVQGIQPAIRQLIEDGVEFVTVTELLTRNGVELQPGSVYWKADRDPR